MKGEINRDWYCALGWTPEECMTCTEPPEICDREECGCRHRKHPTPEQFKEEYGEKYPYEGAVYSFFDDGQGWVAASYKWAKEEWAKRNLIVCACTPWGKPPNDWRPE